MLCWIVEAATATIGHLGGLYWLCRRSGVSSRSFEKLSSSMGKAMAVNRVKDFEVVADFAAINWGATLQYNFMRTACSALTCAFVLPLIDVALQVPNRNVLGDSAAFLLAVPAMYVLIALPLRFLGTAIASIFPAAAGFIGLIAILPTLFTCVAGGPLLYVVWLLRPRWVPVVPPLFDADAFAYVLNGDLLQGIKTYR